MKLCVKAYVHHTTLNDIARTYIFYIIKSILFVVVVAVVVVAVVVVAVVVVSVPPHFEIP
jgi:hypothetical protein